MNLHIYPSPFTHESRMLRELRSITSLGIEPEVLVLCVGRSGLPAHQHMGGGIRVRRLRLFAETLLPGKIGKILGHAEFLARATLIAFRHKVSVINCHSLSVLPIGYVMKKFGKTRRLIYDAHELETERAGHSKFGKRVTKVMERNLLPAADHLIVVCDPIADWYRREYGFNAITVLRNVPEGKGAAKNSGLRKQLGIKPDDLIFIYQGVLSKLRGVPELLQVFASLPPSRHLVLMGYGPLEDEIIRFSKQHENVHFMPAVAPEEVLGTVAGADVGLFYLPDNSSLSYRYAAPNKFYESMHAGCPVLITNSLEYLSGEVRKHGLGWTTAPSVEEFGKKLKEIQVEDVKACSHQAKQYACANSWDSDRLGLFEAFGIPVSAQSAPR